MRKAAIIFFGPVMLCAVLLSARISLGQTSTNITVDASVSDCVDFTWNMHRLLGEEDPWGGDPDQTAMNFQNISELDGLEYPGRMFTDIWFCVFMMTNVTEAYHIKQTSTSLMTTDGLHNLDKNFVVIPDYNANDKWDGLYSQGALQTGEQLGSASLVKDANILFSGQFNHILRLYYSIPAQPKVAVTGWQPISMSQAEGTYTGTVTLTITPQAP